MYKALTTRTLKSNNFFYFVNTLNDDSAIADWQITAVIKDYRGQLITTLEVKNINEADKTYELHAPDGFVLPAGTMFFDVNMVKDGRAINSDIVQLDVLEVVTTGAE